MRAHPVAYVQPAVLLGDLLMAITEIPPCVFVCGGVAVPVGMARKLPARPPLWGKWLLTGSSWIRK